MTEPRDARRSLTLRKGLEPMPSLRLPSPSSPKYERIVIGMAALVGSLMRSTDESAWDRSRLERTIHKRRTRIVAAITALSRIDFVWSDEVPQFCELVPDAYLDRLRKDWTAVGEIGNRR